MKPCLYLATIVTNVLACFFMGDTCRAQCLDWDPAPGPSGASDYVRTLATLDLGSGPALYIGGSFTAVDGISANRIARWNGTVIEPLGTGFTGVITGGGPVTSVDALTVFDDGSGPVLYAAGNFATAGGVSASGIAKWNGTAWSALGSGLSEPARALAVFDDGSGSALYVGLAQHVTAGGLAVQGLARWNGTSWSALAVPPQGSVQSLAVFDDGGGAKLYAAGIFTIGGTGIISAIWKWVGPGWSFITPIPNGSSTHYGYMIGFDDGTGSSLYVSGSSVGQGPLPFVSSFVTRWNGTSWSSIWGTSCQVPCSGGVGVLEAFDDGSGPALYGVGAFTQTPAGQSANRIAKWNGASWSALGSGLDSSGYALAVFDDNADGASDLYVGGAFTAAGGEAVDKMAVWHGCPPGTAYCFGDGLDPVVTAACPCLNFGAADHGCANSAFASGARLIASGNKSADTVVLQLSNAPNNSLATGFRNTGNASPGGVVFGDGVRCQTGTLIRFGSHNIGSLGDAPNTWTASADAVAAGLTRYYQVQYRNSSPAFCPPETFNISNGYRIDW